MYNYMILVCICYVACILSIQLYLWLYICTTYIRKYLRASIQLCFHDFKANIKVVLTTLMTWQTFQGEMRERERKKERAKGYFFPTEQLTASSALKSLINTGPCCCNYSAYNARKLFLNAAQTLGIFSSENYFQDWSKLAPWYC